MKKVILMLAAVASLMMVSCGKGDGKAAGSDSVAAQENAESSEPVVLNCHLSSTSGDFSTLKPSLDMMIIPDISLKSEILRLPANNCYIISFNMLIEFIND